MYAPVSLRSWFPLMTLCFLCSAGVAWAGFERYCNTDRHMQTNKGICGHYLANILSTVCRMYNKRDSPSRMLPHQSSYNEDNLPEQLDTNIFLPKQDALAVFKRGLRFSGTITCECCVHRCGIMELRQYCSEVEPLKRTEELLAEQQKEEGMYELETERTTTEQATTTELTTTEVPQTETSALPFDQTTQEPIPTKKIRSKEALHLEQKRRIGASILRTAPSWWNSINQLAAYMASSRDSQNRVNGK